MYFVLARYSKTNNSTILKIDAIKNSKINRYCCTIMPRMLLLTLMVTLSGLFTDARSLSNSDVVSEDERLFLASSLDASLVAVTNTTATLQFNGGNPCVEATTLPFV